MGSACAERVRSRRQGVLVILWVQELTPSIALQLLPRGVGVVTEPLITLIRQAIGAHDPDKLGDGIQHDTHFFFALLFVINILADPHPFLDPALSPAPRPP